MPSYDKGDLVRCSASFTDSDGTALDPTTVTGKYKTPAGVTTTYVYDTDAELVKDSTGNYHFDVNANAAGQWFYRFESTGTGQAAEEAAFTVEAGDF